MASSTVTAAALGAAVVLLAAHPALAEPLQLGLTNGASRDLEEFYASPAGAGAEQDILGAAFCRRATPPLSCSPRIRASAPTI